MTASTEIRPLLVEISLELAHVSSLAQLIDESQESESDETMNCLVNYKFVVMGLDRCLKLFRKVPLPKHLPVENEGSNCFEIEVLKVRGLCDLLAKCHEMTADTCALTNLTLGLIEELPEYLDPVSKLFELQAA